MNIEPEFAATGYGPLLVDGDALLDYLDNAIRKWRDARDFANSDADRHTAKCYVDAFQSVRASVFGDTLP